MTQLSEVLLMKSTLAVTVWKDTGADKGSALGVATYSLLTEIEGYEKVAQSATNAEDYERLLGYAAELEFKLLAPLRDGDRNPLVESLFDMGRRNMDLAIQIGNLYGSGVRFKGRHGL